MECRWSKGPILSAAINSWPGFLSQPGFVQMNNFDLKTWVKQFNVVLCQFIQYDALSPPMMLHMFYIFNAIMEIQWRFKDETIMTAARMAYQRT
jgi:hypothetical protein